MREEIQKGAAWLRDFHWALRYTDSVTEPFITTELPFAAESPPLAIIDALAHPETLLVFPLCWQACLFGSYGNSTPKLTSLTLPIYVLREENIGHGRSGFYYRQSSLIRSSPRDSGPTHRAEVGLPSYLTAFLQYESQTKKPRRFHTRASLRRTPEFAPTNPQPSAAVPRAINSESWLLLRKGQEKNSSRAGTVPSAANARPLPTFRVE